MSAAPRRLVLLRHGQTSWNVVLRAQGETDIALDETGHAQAAAAASVLAALGPVRLWTSDLTRARETASYVATAAGLEPVVDPRLQELHLGERAGLTTTEFAEAFPEEHARWRETGYAHVAGAETRGDLLARSVPALQDGLAALEPGETGIAVGHGWSLKAAVVGLLGLPPEADRVIRGMNNCHWGVLVSDEDGRTRLDTWNQHA
ncbi:phosphoglycerate mutase [Marmoricola endophyticus]|uniref:Phosphoglycerate mutase n=1 Tax=Marmoricola endophyticus TaxID=2040280 RepID=A0A917F2W1_9ACTN|nr:histidine phosphatase family protein [Marmoricola endophyticus]GGF37740.1 phosphoglycerate mutase [Marmoricola endophyticus]